MIARHQPAAIPLRITSFAAVKNTSATSKKLILRSPFSDADPLWFFYILLFLYVFAIPIFGVAAKWPGGFTITLPFSLSRTLTEYTVRNDLEGWCADPGLLATWNLAREGAQDCKPDTTIDVTCCLTACAFHPQKPVSKATKTRFEVRVLCFGKRRPSQLRIESTPSQRERPNMVQTPRVLEYSRLDVGLLQCHRINVWSRDLDLMHRHPEDHKLIRVQKATFVPTLGRQMHFCWGLALLPPLRFSLREKSVVDGCVRLLSQEGRTMAICMSGTSDLRGTSNVGDLPSATSVTETPCLRLEWPWNGTSFAPYQMKNFFLKPHKHSGFVSLACNPTCTLYCQKIFDVPKIIDSSSNTPACHPWHKWFGGLEPGESCLCARYTWKFMGMLKLLSSSCLRRLWLVLTVMELSMSIYIIKYYVG